MLEAFGLTDPGCLRTNNEDYFISDRRAGIFIIADGMGGANAGEYASKLSAESLYEFLLFTGSRGNTLETLKLGFLNSNRLVRAAAAEDSALDGMGTTLLAVREVAGGEWQIGSVGDSRAYLCSNNELELITQDQTWIAEVGSRLGLSEQVLRHHPMRHVLTMAIGCADDLRVFCQPLTVAPGDQILLCSDGLHGILNQRILHETLVSEKSLPDKCHYLIEAAKRDGGPDNITVVLIQIV